MKKILVLCTGNSCRSQIAHGYLNHFADRGRTEVYSAGITTHGVNPRAIATMKDDGIDISDHTSNNVTDYENIDFDYVITVCDNASENCPVWIGRSVVVHRNFPDPPKFVGSEAEIVAEFARVRDMIKVFCQQFVDDHNL